MNKTKTNFFISIGNTRTSFAYFPEHIDSIKIIKTKTKNFFNNISFEDIFNQFGINPNKIFVCSVVEEVNHKLVTFFPHNEIVFLKHDNQKIINLNLLDNPQEIGNDIIASAIYAKSLGQNVTVVSLGTASVISNIVEGSLLGCIIMPGLEISYNALIQNTAINKVELTPLTSIIGTSTQKSLSIGIINGHKAMIKELTKPFHTPQTKYVYFGGNTSYIELNNWKKIEDIDLLGLYLFSVTW